MNNVIVGIGFSVKMAPGVRVRVSPRGVRTSLGPRVARIHVGAGRTTVSTGAGPMTLWATPGSNRRRRSGSRVGRGAGYASPRAVSLTALQRQAAAAERESEIRRISALEQALLTQHLADFPPAHPPVAPMPDVNPLIAARFEQAVKDLPALALRRRSKAKKWAKEAAQQDAVQQQAELQARYDAAWRLLLNHDPAAVHDALENAFEDNQHPAACIDVGYENGVRYATVLILYGPVDLVPERRPALTPTGRPTLHKRTKTDRNDFYVSALASTVLATVKEAFAVAPSVTELRVAVLRKDPQADSPQKFLEWIYAARFPRDWVAGFDWHSIDPAEVLLRAPEAQFERKGAAGNVVGLPLDEDPDLRSIVEAVRESGELP